jgi:hypothetical protein
MFWKTREPGHTTTIQSVASHIGVACFSSTTSSQALGSDLTRKKVFDCDRVIALIASIL